MRINITNGNYSAAIDSLGAELVSLKKGETNILWDRNPLYWADSALLLFPFIGRNYNDTYLYRGKEYIIPIHGFALRCEFEVMETSDNSVTFMLTENEDSFQHFPFRFHLFITYTLMRDGLAVNMKVENNSMETMPYTIGYHPGFKLDKPLEDYSIYFPNAENPQEIGIVTKCMLNGDNHEVILNNNTLSLSKDLFTNSAKVYSGLGNKAVLLNKDKDSLLEIEYNGFENIVLWQTLNSDANFICIEGWRGLPGRFEHIDDIEKVECKSLLKCNETAKYSAFIKF